MMRSLLLVGLSTILSVANAGKTPASGPVHVSGYTTKNGTYVAPYYRRAPGTAGTTYTAPTVKIYSSCADARAAGRWNILKTDADYSPSLDRDSDGIACEAGSDGTSNGRDPDPVVTGGVMAPGSASNPITTTLTYPEQLAGMYRWKTGAAGCDALKTELQADYDASTDPTTPEYLTTDSYTDPTQGISDVMTNIGTSKIPVTAASGWTWRQRQNPAIATIRVQPTAEVGISYLTFVMPAPAGTTAICITAYALRR